MSKKPIVIAFSSGKGGVGKSFITANIGYIISTKFKTLIWDADIDFPNQHIMFGVEPAFRMNDYYSKKRDVKKYFYKLNDNLSLAAGQPAVGYDKQEGDLIIFSTLEAIIKENQFEIILIDTGSGLSVENIQSCLVADLVNIVVSDEPTSLLDAFALIKVLSNKMDLKKIFLVANNMVDFDDVKEISKKFNLATQKFLKQQINVLDYINYDRNIRYSIMKQEPFIKIYPHTEAAKALLSLSEKILNGFKLN